MRIEIVGSTGGEVIGTIDSVSPSTNGAVSSSGTLYLQSASATMPGLVNTTTQSFAGNKTFTGTIAASNLSGTNTGDVTLAAVGSSPNANAASLAAQVLNLQPASASFPGVVTTGTQTLAGAKTFSSDLTVNTMTIGLGANAVATNTALGLNTLTHSPTSGDGATAVGAYALSNMTTGNRNTAVGHTSLYNLSDGGYNTAVGSSSLGGTDHGSGNTALGFSALTDNTSGSSNVALGKDTGGIAAGSNNTYVGYGATAASNSLTNSTALGNGAQFSASNQMAFGNSSVTTNVFQGNVSAASATLSGLTASQAVFTDGSKNLVSNAITGSGNVVMSAAPTMTNPVVGTQSQGDSSTKAASTSYVDVAVANAVAGVNPAEAVHAATTAASDTSGFTYNNGVSGVGATFTGTANTAVTIDGYTFTAVGQRLLVKNDTQSPSGAFNGVYYVTQIQTAILAPIFTRTLDYNTPTDMNNTGAIPVINGTVNTTTSWLQTSLIGTVGTTPLVFVKFTRNPADYLLVANNLSDVATKATAFNNLSPMTTGGDLIYGGASGTGTRLANGTAGQVLTSAGTTVAPSWSAVNLATAASITGILPVANGGTGSSAITNSYYRHDNSSGPASTNTKIQYWGTTLASAGTDITYNSSSTNGDNWTINTAGTYAITYSDSSGGGGFGMGISLNSNQLTTSIFSITASMRLVCANPQSANETQNCSWTGYLAVNDVIRCHTDGGSVSGVPLRSSFTIYRIY